MGEAVDWPVVEGWVWEREVGYGADAGQVYSMLRPDVGRGRGVVILVHGGGWVKGSRLGEHYLGAMVRLAKAGLVSVTMDYRLAPGFVFPAALEDVKGVVESVRGLGYGEGGVGLVGSSAGGHLVSLAGMDAGFCAAFGVRGVVSFSAPYDFRPHEPQRYAQGEEDPAVMALLGGRRGELAEEASPLAWLERAEGEVPDFFLGHNRRDPRVDCRFSLDFARALRRLGLRLEIVVWAGEGHGMRRVSESVWDRVLRFLLERIER